MKIKTADGKPYVPIFSYPTTKRAMGFPIVFGIGTVFSIALTLVLGPDQLVYWILVGVTMLVTLIGCWFVYTVDRFWKRRAQQEFEAEHAESAGVAA